jgi:uncharacterized repeat protein (TIGR03847 family)
VAEPRRFENADIAVGAFGEPGQRVFLLQLRSMDATLTVKVEKTQVAQLAEHLGEAMAGQATFDPDAVPAAGSARLEHQLEPEWAVGAIRLGYDASVERVALVLEGFSRDEDEEPQSALVLVSVQAAAALIAEIESLVAAGRPACELCGYPLDPSGHVCPKTNGHKPPKL